MTGNTIEDLTLAQYPLDFVNSNKALPLPPERSFVLETCQRTLFVSLGTPFLLPPKIQVFTGAKAYQHLLEVHCGLKSSIVAEVEIVSQFKKAYGNYLKGPQKNTRLMKLIEKLFKDGKEVRRKHLLKIGQQSYVGISRHLLRQKSQTTKGVPVLITGSGAMAQDLIKVLSKDFQLTLSGRNSQKLFRPEMRVIPWPLPLKSASLFPYIINAIGTSETLFPPSFFDLWRVASHGRKKLFIDLGIPSPIKTPHGPEDDVYRLHDVLQCGVMLDEIKRKKIAQAREHIRYLVGKRSR